MSTPVVACRLCGSTRWERTRTYTETQREFLDLTPGLVAAQLQHESVDWQTHDVTDWRCRNGHKANDQDDERLSDAYDGAF